MLTTMLLWNVLLTSVLALLLAIAGRFSLLRRRPAVRHTLWLLLLVKLVTPPLIPLPLLPGIAADTSAAASTSLDGVETAAVNGAAAETPAAEAPPAQLRPQTSPVGSLAAPAAAPAAELLADGQNESAADEPLDAAAGTAFGGNRILTWLLAVSLLGSGLLLVVQVVRAAAVGRWLRRGEATDGRLQRCCRDVAADLNIRRPIHTCAVDARTPPLLWGLRRPVVVMSRQLIDSLKPSELRCIVAHELAHYRRGDHWSNSFALLVKTLMWWNPVAWWAHRELRDAQELCCDALAISLCDHRGYAQTLLNAIEFVQSGASAPRDLALEMGGRCAILRRFEMIADPQLSHRLPRTAWLLLLLAVFPLWTIPVSGQVAADEPVAGGTVSGGDDSPEDKPLSTDEPAADKPVTDEPTTDKPVSTDEPVELVTDKPVTDEPVTDKPATRKPRGEAKAGDQPQDAEVRLTLNGETDTVILRGNKANVRRISEWLKALEQKGKQARAKTALRSYALGKLDGQTVLQVLQTLLAGEPGVRIAVDVKVNRLIVLAPEKVHETIKASLIQLGAAPAAEKPAGKEQKLQMAFNRQPWKDVFAWYAELAGLTLVFDDMVQGTFSYTDRKPRTPAEVFDLLNAVLLPKGYTLLQRDRTLFVLKINGGVPLELVPRVSPDELDQRGKLEFVNVMFPLDGRDASQVKEEITPLLSSVGRVIVLPKAGRILVVDRANMVRSIRSVIESIKPVPTP